MKAVNTREFQESGWVFFSRATHVVLCIARNPEVTMREISATLEITERSVQKLVRKLEAEGVITRKREGRNNRYTLGEKLRLNHTMEGALDPAEIIALVLDRDRLSDRQPEN